MPTSPLADEGQTMEPSVSVPRVAAARLAADAVPEPELRAARIPADHVRV